MVPNIVLMHMAQTPGLGFTTDCTGIVLPVPHLNMTPYLEPVVPLLDLIRSFVDTQVAS
jgi:hypothetical protein